MNDVNRPKYVVFPLRASKEGRKRGEYPLGTVEFSLPDILFDIPDRKVLARLRKHFSQNYKIPVFAGTEGVMAHRFEELEPADEGHFEEGLRRLVRLDMVAIREAAATFPGWV